MPYTHFHILFWINSFVTRNIYHLVCHKCITLCCVCPLMSSTHVLLYTASNFLTNTQCGCESPLICNHGQRFAVKVGWESRVTSQIDLGSSYNICTTKPSATEKWKVWKCLPSAKTLLHNLCFTDTFHPLQCTSVWKMLYWALSNVR